MVFSAARADRDPLALAAGQPHPAVPYASLQAVRQPFNQAAESRWCARRRPVFLGRFRGAERRFSRSVPDSTGASCST